MKLYGTPGLAALQTVAKSRSGLATFRGAVSFQYFRYAFSKEKKNRIAHISCEQIMLDYTEKTTNG